MLKNILKSLFPKTIASIVDEAIDNHWFDVQEAQIISQYGSLANYQDHLKELDRLHQEIYEQEMRERLEAQAHEEYYYFVDLHSEEAEYEDQEGL